MAEFGIHPYHRSDAPVADLVLVHGLMGNSRDTWTGKDAKGQRTYWPDWIKAQRPDVNIWLADYDSSVIAWAQPAMPLDQIGGSFLLHAKDQGLGERPIHWVGHSMGGLIIKHLLRQAREKADADWHILSDASRAITFLGTPHHGSDLVKWKEYFYFLLSAWDFLQAGGLTTGAVGAVARGLKFLGIGNRSSHVDELAAHGKALGDLNDAFAQWLGAAARSRSSIQVRNYYEALPVFKTVTVVPRHSAQLSNDLVVEAAAQANHFDICKFSSVENAVFKGLVVSLDGLSKRTKKIIDELPESHNSANEASGGQFANDRQSVGEKNPHQSARRDLLDRAWRQALKECSIKVRALLCDEMKKVLEGQDVVPDDVEKAFDLAFNRVAPVNILTSIRYALGYPRPSCAGLSAEERCQRTVLYVLLLARAVALWRQEDLRARVSGGAIVPDADDSKRLAIAVAAHLISGQGLLLKIVPDAVRPENLLDAVALVDAHAHPPGRPLGPSPLENEIRAWLRRVLNMPHAPQATELLKVYLDRFEDDHHARPILLDIEGVLVDPEVKALVDQLGIGLVNIAANGRSANIASEDWETLCHAFELKASDLVGPASLKPSSPEADLKQNSAQSFQVNLHQTFSGPVSQSNVTTGNQSPIQAEKIEKEDFDVTGNSLVVAVLGFEGFLGGDSDIKSDLREFHGLVLRRDASPSALSLFPRLLRPLRAAAQTSMDANGAWQRLCRAAHAHWPDSRDFI